jgi:hypothetical protein
MFYVLEKQIEVQSTQIFSFLGLTGGIFLLALIVLSIAVYAISEFVEGPRGQGPSACFGVYCVCSLHKHAQCLTT